MAGTEAREEIINITFFSLSFSVTLPIKCTYEGMAFSIYLSAREGEKVRSEREPPKCPSMAEWINRM